MISFKAGAILASSSSKFGKSLPAIDRDDFNSYTDSTISTSLIHNIACEENRNKNLPGFWILPSNNKWLWSREFVKLKFRYLLSLLPNHRTLRNIYKKRGAHGRRPSCKCRHWNCASYSFFLSCHKSPCADKRGSLTCSIWCHKWMSSLIRYLQWLERRTWICKNVFQ